MKSYYEIGGILMDGSVGYDHRKFKRVRKELTRGNTNIAVALVLDHVVPAKEDDGSIPYSDLQIAGQEWSRRNKKRLRRLVAPLPIPMPVKVAIGELPTVVDLWSRGVGSYDMRTPEVQAYEESVTFGGSGGMII
jgi:hypothetical protein